MRMILIIGISLRSTATSHASKILREFIIWHAQMIIARRRLLSKAQVTTDAKIAIWFMIIARLLT